MSTEGGPKQKRGIRGVMAGIKKLVDERITMNEVREHLSYTQWKTWNVVFEEILDARAKRGQSAPDKDREPRRRGWEQWGVLTKCSSLVKRKEAETKYRYQMSDEEKQWSRRTAEEQEVEDNYDRGERRYIPPFYFRLVRDGRRHRIEQEGSEPSPIEVKL